MQQLDLFATLDTPADAHGPAETHEEIRRRSREGLCQACGAAIDAEWLLLSFGWECRECEAPALAPVVPPSLTAAAQPERVSWERLLKMEGRNDRHAHKPGLGRHH
jgi:hypothetical protein